MKTGSKGINLIKEFEGCRLVAYKCPAGVWTIGYGHTGSDVFSGLSITHERAEELLKKDLEKYEGYVEKYVPFPLNQNQFDALVSFTYNCGAGNLQQLVNGRDAATVAEKMLLYNKAGGKTLAGLVRRREAERELFLQSDGETEKTPAPVNVERSRRDPGTPGKTDRERIFLRGSRSRRDLRSRDRKCGQSIPEKERAERRRDRRKEYMEKAAGIRRTR